VDELRFKILLDAYGSDVERWPAAEREEGRRRLAAIGGSERALLDENAALDALLRMPRPQQASAALMGRIMAAAPSEPRAAGVFGPVVAILGLNRQAQLAAAALLLLSAGVLAGWTASHDLLGFAAGDALLAASYGETADELFSVEEL
jgi:anti-sigma factor RsiW